MASNNKENYPIDSENVSSLSSTSASLNLSSSHTLTNDSPRRSARLLTKSPQAASKSSTGTKSTTTKSTGTTATSTSTVPKGL